MIKFKTFLKLIEILIQNEFLIKNLYNFIIDDFIENLPKIEKIEDGEFLV